MVSNINLLSYYNLIAKNASSQTNLLNANGYNTIVGGDGDDLITSFGNYNLLYGGSGDDQMYSYGNYNNIYGENGDDSIYSYGNYNNIYGGAGDDSIQYYGSNNYVDGGTGNDSIVNSFFSMLQYIMPLLSQSNQQSQVSYIPAYSQTTTPTTSTTVSAPALSQSSVSSSGQGVWGDPHFDIKDENGNSIKFDHKGTDGHTYNVFTGDNLTVDALYVPYSDPENPQVMGKVSIKAGTQNITWDANGKPMVDGKELTKGETKLTDGTKVNYDGSKLTITSSDGDGVVDITTSSSKGSNYLNVDPSGKFSNLGGILGTAIDQSRALSNDECNKFDVTNTRPISTTTTATKDETAAKDTNKHKEKK